jgi:hypothetical protein
VWQLRAGDGTEGVEVEDSEGSLIEVAQADECGQVEDGFLIVDSKVDEVGVSDGFQDVSLGV